MEIKDMTAVQLSAAIKEGKITVSDAVEASLAAVRASEDAIHAFLLVDEEGARARAAEVQKKIDAGELTGPHAGFRPRPDHSHNISCNLSPGDPAVHNCPHHS